MDVRSLPYGGVKNQPNSISGTAQGCGVTSAPDGAPALTAGHTPGPLPSAESAQIGRVEADRFQEKTPPCRTSSEDLRVVPGASVKAVSGGEPGGQGPVPLSGGLGAEPPPLDLSGYTPSQVERIRVLVRDRRERDRVHVEWVRFIKELDQRSRFDWYTTLTFRDGTHPEAAMKAYRRWEHCINRHVYGVRYTGRPGDGISSVVAIEYQRRGVLHFHALQAGLTVTRAVGDREARSWSVVGADGRRGFRRLTAMDWWWDMGRRDPDGLQHGPGIARIYPFRPRCGAETYVSKYVAKGGDIFLVGPFCSSNPPLWPSARSR